MGQCRAISSQAEMFTELLQRARSYFTPLVAGLESVIREEGDDWNEYSDSSKKAVCAAVAMAGTVTKILKTPILNKEGKPDENSGRIAQEVAKALPKA